MRKIALLIVLASCALAAGAGLAAVGRLPGTKTAADRTAWRAKLHWPASCEQDWRTTPQLASSSAGVTISAATVQALRLVRVTCYVAAYQETFLLYLMHADGKPTGPLVLPTYIEGPNGKPKLVREALLLGVASFAPASGRLVVFDKGRGIGDCGILSTYKLHGTTFAPVEFRAKLACNGKPPLDPGNWPKLPLPR